jgi:CHAD domain-containing protein
VHRTSPSAAAVLGPYVAAQVAIIARLDPLVRLGDPDAIHDMRVAVRRLKAVLAAYRSAFEPATGRELRAELDWLAETLGQARDHEVQRLLLLDVSDKAGIAQVDAADRAMGIKAQAALSAALMSARYRVLTQELARFGASPAWTPAARQKARKVLLPSLGKQFARVESRVASARKTSSQAKVDERLHRVRKSVKRARYATEAVDPILRAANIAKQLSTTQDVLGLHNDLVVTRSNAARWRELGVTSLEGAGLDRLDERARATRKQARRALTSLREVVAATRPTLDVTLQR